MTQRLKRERVERTGWSIQGLVWGSDKHTVGERRVGLIEGHDEGVTVGGGEKRLLIDEEKNVEPVNGVKRVKLVGGAERKVKTREWNARRRQVGAGWRG